MTSISGYNFDITTQNTIKVRARFLISTFSSEIPQIFFSIGFSAEATYFQSIAGESTVLQLTLYTGGDLCNHIHNSQFTLAHHGCPVWGATNETTEHHDKGHPPPT